MKTSKMNVTRFLVSVALCCALMIGSLAAPATVADAAAKKAAISTTTMTIPVGKLDRKVYWNDIPWERSNEGKLTVKNAVKGATYQFTSSDTKVADISKTGGYLTGIKAGSATITVTQTYQNKKTTIGKCKVTVKAASVTASDYGNEFPVGDGVYDLSSLYNFTEPLFNIAYRNPDATYTLATSSSDFSINEVKYDASKIKAVTDNKDYQDVLKDFIGDSYFYGYEFSAKKAGTYTLTVKETYNNKTRTLGSLKAVVKKTSIAEPKVDMLLGESAYTFYFVSYAKPNTTYYFSVKNSDKANPDKDVVVVVSNGSEQSLKANKAGKAEVVIREGSEDGTVIGTVKITVKALPCKKITFNAKEYKTYVGDYFFTQYEVDPWNTTDKVTIKSDQPKILKVEYDKENNYWTYTPLAVGEATVTIKCGNQTAVCKVIVEEQ